MAGTGETVQVCATNRVFLLLTLIRVKHTQHPHQEGGKARTFRGAELSPFHLEGCITPSIYDAAPAKKKKRKNWKEVLGWLCPKTVAVSCGSNASHPAACTFKELLACKQAGTQNTMNECLTAHCGCSDTAPFAKKKKCACVDVCIYKGFKEDIACIFTALLKGFVLCFGFI